MLPLRSPTRFARHRFVHISRVSFKDVFVNWNEELSLQAKCDDCGEGPHLSYSWDLFLVNATERTRMEGTVIATFILLTQGGLGYLEIAENVQILTRPDQCPWSCPPHRGPQPLSFTLMGTEEMPRCHGSASRT